MGNPDIAGWPFLKSFLGFAVLLLANADHRSEDAYALLAFVDPAAKLVPCVHPGYSGRRRPLSRDFENIAKRVAMEAAHCCEVGSESF